MAIFGVVQSSDIMGKPTLSLRVCNYLPDAEIHALEKERMQVKDRLCKTKSRLLNIDERLRHLYELKEKTRVPENDQGAAEG